MDLSFRHNAGNLIRFTQLLPASSERGESIKLPRLIALHATTHNLSAEDYMRHGRNLEPS